MKARTKADMAKHAPQGKPLSVHGKPVQRRSAAARIDGPLVRKTPRRVNRKRVVTVTLFAGCCVAVIVLHTVRLPTSVGGKIRRLGDLVITYTDPQRIGTSPLCGCDTGEESRPDEWRGVTFAARNLLIHRTGGPQLTQYLITPAYPGKMTWNPHAFARRFKMECEAFILTIPAEGEFDPAALNAETIPPGYHIERHTVFAGEGYASFITDKEFHVALLGSVPLVAWIPTTNSSVALQYRKGMFASSRSAFSLQEKYLAWQGDFAERTFKEILTEAEYPVADFLGPNIIFWSADEKGVLAVEKGGTFEQKPDEGRKSVLAFLIKRAPWSARLACIPVDSQWKSEYLYALPDLGDALMARALDAPGEITLSATDDDQDRVNLRRVYEQLRANDRVWVRNIPAMYTTDDNQVVDQISMEFRYPPMPPIEGCNIFGNLSHLEVHSALGRLDAAGQEIDMQTATSVELRDMKDPSFEAGVLKIPVKADAGDVEFSVKSVSQLKINGQTRNNIGRIIGIRTEYEFLMLALTGLSVYIALAMHWKAGRATKH